MNNREKGSRFEEIALNHLRGLGFELLQRSFYTRFGEIDLVMSRSGTLHFVEVKMSSRFNPFANITSNKIKKITDSVEVFLCKYPLESLECSAYCLSAVGIHKGKIILIENITI